MPALQAFEQAAVHSSFADAARDLGRTPSAISHAIKKMEERLGTTLFERVGRSVRLTRAGAAYLESVQTALSGLRSATRHIARDQDRYVVRVSALPFFTSTVLLPNLGRFESDHPHYDLRLETTNAYADVLNGDVDVALRFGTERSRDLICKPLISVCGQPVASPAYLDSAPSLRKPADLKHHTLIHVRANERAWDEWYGAHGGDRLDATRNLSFDSILGALDAVTRGVGVALAMHPLITAYRGYGTEFVPVLKPARGYEMNYNFVCQRAAMGERKIRHTFEWLEHSIERLTTH